MLLLLPIRAVGTVVSGRGHFKNFRPGFELSHVLPFASNRELRPFYHVCLRFKCGPLPLKRANFNLSIEHFLLQNRHVFKPHLQCFQNLRDVLFRFVAV